MTQRKVWLVGLAAFSLALYVLLWVGIVQQWSWVEIMDRFALDPLHTYGLAHPGWVRFWDVLCTVLGPTVFRLAALVVIIVALARRKVRVAMFLIISVELSGLITEVAKAAANRQRPAGALVSAQSTSFPSGHALGVMVGVLAFLTLALPIVRRPARFWLIVLGVVVVLAIGAARVVLCVHHPSDVLAGWALGFAWFVGCVLMVPPAVPVTATDEIPEAPGSSL
ncbi:MAG TPA: phosphatase PAP2 family protein [Mycobacterium sp.]|nr:phosphatase PAP2 family protein [Mycobacterium sp.]